jgi:cyclic pyranopterin phosphate synthase
MPMETYGEDYSFLDPDHYLSFDEITRLVRLFARRGVEKIRITGGEPLLRPNLEALIQKIDEVEGIQDIALTTNGYLLADQAEALADAGLHRVTVSLDALDPELFREMNGVGKGPEPVLEGIEAAGRAGLEPIKINTVVRRGVNDESVLPLVRHFRGTGRIVRFIEYMDVGTKNGWDRSEVVPSAELKDRISDEFPIEPLDPNYPGEVANRYRFLDGAGEIGFVSSVTNPFCGNCTRARLSTEGSLYTCLFATEGTDFRAPLRDGVTDEEILDRIDAVWGERDDRYSERRSEDTTRPDDRVEMYEIGG